MAETIIKHVSAENLKQYDGLIKQYLETKDAAIKAALEEQIGIVAEALDKEIADARAAEQANATAASNAKTAADNAQADVNALAGKVGEVPSGKTVVGMIEQVIADAYDDTEVRGLITNLDTNKADKTQVATDIAAAVKAEEDARKEAVAGVQGSVDTLAQTVANNKTAIEGTVATLEQKVDDNEADIEGKMTALTNRVAANETAVGTTLPNAINAEKTRAEEAEENLQTQINTIMNNPDTEGVINSINEFTQYIEDHGEIADGFRTDIDKNKEDIASLTQTHATDKSALESAINAKVAQTAYDAKIAVLEDADAGQISRISALEQKVGSGDTTVDSKISTAKEEAISTAAEDATSKANKALEDAKKYADDEDAKIEVRVETLEGDAHTHGNKALLDTYTQTEANLADAVAKKHAHANASTLEGITDAKVSAWDASEQNAKDYADGLNEALTAKVDENTAWIASVEFMAEADINAMFTA